MEVKKSSLTPLVNYQQRLAQYYKYDVNAKEKIEKNLFRIAFYRPYRYKGKKKILTKYEGKNNTD